MIQLIIDNVEVPIKKINFSDGGSNIKLEVPQKLIDYPPSAYYSIVVDPVTPVDNYLWEIIQVVDAVEHTFGQDKFKRELLYLPYLPHGRADRVFEYGNGFPLNLFLEAISWMFDEIFLTDPHSNYYEIFKGCDDTIVFNVKPQHQCFIEVAGRDIQSGDILVAPDKGALSKIYKLQQALDVRTIATFVVEAGKKRDIETGRIIETTLPDFDFKGKTVYIIDDIGDGLGTFVPLAEKLKERGSETINLYITHLIASKGLEVLKGKIDKLYVPQIVGDFINLENVRKYNKNNGY